MVYFHGARVTLSSTCVAAVKCAVNRMTKSVNDGEPSLSDICTRTIFKACGLDSVSEALMEVRPVESTDLDTFIQADVLDYLSLFYPKEDIEQIKIMCELSRLRLQSHTVRYGVQSGNVFDDEGYMEDFIPEQDGHIIDVFFGYGQESFHIRFEESFKMDHLGARTSFKSLEQAKAVIAMLLQDIEPNPGPVFTGPRKQNSKMHKRDEKRDVRFKIEVAFEKKEQKKVKQMIREWRDEKMKRCSFQGGITNIAKSAAYAAANAVAPGAGSAAATMIEGPKVLALLNDLGKTTDHLRQCSALTAEQFPTILNTAEATMHNTNAAMASMSAILDQVRERQNSMYSLIDKVCANPMYVLAAIIMAYVVFAYPKIGLGIPALFLILHLLEFDVKLIEKLKQICGMQFQSGETSYKTIGQIVFTILAFFGVGLIPTGTYYDSLLRRLDLIPKGVKGANQIWEKSSEIFAAAEREFRVFVLGQKREDLEYDTEIAQQVAVWVERVEYWLDAVARKRIAKDQEAVNEVTALFKNMSRWLHTREIRQNMPKDVLAIIISLQPRVNELFKLVCSSTVHEGGPRMSPTCIVLSGESRTGKSEALMPLSIAMLHNRGYENVNDFFKNNIYYRNPEIEYWDKYYGQLVCINDDAFQVKDTIGKPSVEFMESVRLCNTAPCQIHCADLNDKGTFFSSEILLYTTNITRGFHRHIESLNCPEAAVRRLNSNAFRVSTHPDYAKPMTVGGKTTHVLDASKVGYTVEKQQKYDRRSDRSAPESNFYCVLCKNKCLNELGMKPEEANMAFCSHHYRFTKYDMGTDQELSGAMTWSEMIKDVTARDTDNRKLEKRKLDLYDMIAANPSVFQMNDEFYDSEVVSEESLELSYDVDLNDEETWMLYKKLVSFRMAYNRMMSRENAEGSLDDFSYQLLRYPELWRLNEGLMYGRVRTRECSAKTLEWFKLALFFDKKDHLFGQASASLNEMRMRWKNYGAAHEICMMAFVREAHLAGETLEVKNAELFECSIDEWGHARNALEAAIQQDMMTPCVAPMVGVTPLPPTMWQRMKRRFHMFREKVSTKIEEFFRSYPFMKFVALAGLMLSVVSVVWTMMPSVKHDEFESADERCRNQVNQLQRPKFESPEENSRTRVNQVTRPKYESSDEGSRTRVNQLTRPKFENVEMSFTPDCEVEDMEMQGLADPGGYQVSMKVALKQLYCLHSDKMVYGNVMFVKGYNLLMNKHFIFLMKESVSEGRLSLDDVLSLSNGRGVRIVQFTVRYLFDHFVSLEKRLSSGEEIDIDAVIVPLDPVETKCAIHGDIIDQFVSKQQLSQLSGTYVGILPTFMNNMTEVTLGTMPGKNAFPTPIPSLKYAAGVRGEYDREVMISTKYMGSGIRFREYWTYDCTTVSGDCGAPLVIQESGIARKILGIHSAGGVGTGMSQCITQEMLRDTLERLPAKFQCYVDVSQLVAHEIGDEEMSGSVPCKDGLLVEGTVRDAHRVTSGSKNDIVPSPLHGEINGEPKTAPTMLRPTNGVDPMAKGVKKFSADVPLLDANMIEVAAADVLNNMNANPANRNRCDYARVLTYEEAVCGVDGDEFLPPLNRKTSMGYGFSSKNGKREAFGYDEWTLDTPLAQEVKVKTMKLIENARNLVQTDVYWTDTLKLERRPVAKVQQGKTRVFTAGPVHFTIAARMYFLGPCAWLMHNRNHNECSPGTNVYSHDWDVIARRLISKAGKASGMIAGDHENFDGRLNGQILWKALDLFNEFCDDGEENARIRRGLWVHIVNAVHINDKTVYRCTHSQPSGCPLTAILNTIYNGISVRLAYMICARDVNESMSMYGFNKRCALVAYGDDNLIAVEPETYQWFNQRTITSAFEKLGHVYTDEAKSGVIEESRSISDVMYLKRRFVFDQVSGRYIAPLELDVVLEIPQWTKKGVMRDQITLDNIDACLRELALHGRDTFTTYARIIQVKCREKNIPYRFRTYQEYFTEVLELPLFQSSGDAYEVCVQGTQFKCDTPRAQELLAQERISSRLQKKMRWRRHSEGYVHIDDRNRVVHVLMDRPSVWGLSYKLDRIHELLEGESLHMASDVLSADKMARLIEKCPWLKCDL
ncbi:hypothetical protein 1 [Beihai picorna-like virus 75]|uniref:hypothetical protein 1 n=1 Tax=Beihai picorna-like virus 75 TaxID=1922622 RepID=UPI00090B66CE|nr:hypothetical protein 1 [Beihai picorna-like virus 75]APG76813.1 hypothetical protein 1 [Beihai picorna-like virus 75]